MKIVSLLTCVLLAQFAFAQCAFKRVYQNKFALYSNAKVLELNNNNVAYIYAMSGGPGNSDFQETFLLLTDPCGNVLFDTLIDFGLGFDLMFDATLTNDDNIVLTLYSEGANYGRLSIVGLMKINPNTGEVIWRKPQLTNFNSMPNGITYNKYNNTFTIAGFSTNFPRRAVVITTDSAGNEINRFIYRHTYDAEFDYATALNDSELVAVGVQYTLSADSNVFLVKTNAQLVPKDTIFPFVKQFKFLFQNNWTAAITQNNKLYILSDGDYYDLSLGRAIMLNEFDFNLNLQKQIRVGNPDLDSGANYSYAYLNTTNDGGLLVAPGFIKLDSNLNTVFYKRYRFSDKEEIEVTHSTQLSDGSYTGVGFTYIGPNLALLVMLRTHSDGRTVSVTPIGSSIKNKIELLPNPSLGNIQVNGLQQGYVQVYNYNGTLVQTFAIEQSQIDATSLNEGLYVLRVYDTQSNLLLQTKHLLVK